MVENNQAGGNGCRCACQDELDVSDTSFDNSHNCCNPQVFTSILLGTLACVLVTGGVFLAFHRWDPMWLLVSGIGIVLIFIGTILHRCSNGVEDRRNSAGSKGCCNRPLPPEHHSHLVANSAGLSEQLLPLTNARSVSQLSLNMLPGYFPPVVSTYGIEQHSAVVQNINRLVQQQQQQSPGSASPGAGKSFILLSLPGDTNHTNLQNLVATVYQLDASVISDNPATDVSSQTSAVKPATTTVPVLKNAEVQTCNVWPALGVPSAATTSNNERSTNSASTTADNGIVNVSQSENQTTREASCGTTQTEVSTSTAGQVNLMDCSPDPASICDSNLNASDIQCINDSAFGNTPDSSSNVLVDVFEPSNTVLIDISEMPSSIAVDIPVTSSCTVDGISDPPLNDPPTHSSEILVVNIDGPSTDVLVDISEQPNLTGNAHNSEHMDQELSLEPERENAQTCTVASPDESCMQQLQTSVAAAVDFSQLGVINSELSSSSSNLSAIDGEIDEGEFLGRSSPPPSYDDVTNESEAAIGAFGLAYGTI